MLCSAPSQAPRSGGCGEGSAGEQVALSPLPGTLQPLQRFLLPKNSSRRFFPLQAEHSRGLGTVVAVCTSHMWMCHSPLQHPTAFLLRRSSWLGRTVLSWPTLLWLDVAFRSHVVSSDPCRSLFTEPPSSHGRCARTCQPWGPCCHPGGLVLTSQLLHPLPAELCT